VARQLDAAAGRVETGHANLAAGGHEDAGEHLDRGRFTGAVGADVADHFAGLDRERDAVNRPHIDRFARELSQQAAHSLALARDGKPLLQVIDANDWGHGGVTSPPTPLH
jgi:hypothetical protein